MSMTAATLGRGTGDLFCMPINKVLMGWED